MIPADLTAELARAVSAAVAARELPPAAARLTAGGTWRPAPGESASGGPAGSYATSLAFDLARLAAQPPPAVAARLARALASVGWISSAAPTGAGYLTIQVTDAALASLAVRITRAGPSCARSAALAGVTTAAPPLPDLAAAPGWRQAWRDQADALAGRLAIAAGATALPAPPPEPPCPAAPSAAAGPASVASAVGYGGAEAVRYRLARMAAAPGTAWMLERPVTWNIADPWCLVSFAHADAASVRRWAADLGLRRGEPDERLAGLLAQPAELALLTRLSWLAERVAGAARRGRPAELPRYLEELAGAWLDCRESCPALPFGGQAAPPGEAGISARLWLAEAARTVLAAGLDLVGVTPRERLPVNELTASVVL